MKIEDFRKVVPIKNIEDELEWFSSIEVMTAAYGINTPMALAAFLAQVGHESINFSATEENLSYSAMALFRVFTKYFPTLESAVPYARQPEKIANLVYANRLGNGPMETQEGWQFRGRGLIQLTGKKNYMAFAASMMTSLEFVERYLVTKPGAVESACWFWTKGFRVNPSKAALRALAKYPTTHTLTDIANAGDFQTTTLCINGGLNGDKDRRKRYKKAIKVFT